MEILGLVLLFVWILKLAAIANAVCWMRRYGPSFRKRYRENRPVDQTAYYDLFEQSHGNFFPFGAKDYILRRFIHQETGQCTNQSFVLRTTARYFQTWLFRFNRLTVITCMYLVVTVCVSRRFPSLMLFKPNVQDVFHVAFAVLVVLGQILLSVESIISYAILGNYAVLFHMFSPPDPNAAENAGKVAELFVFLGKLLAALCSSASLCFVSQVLYSWFDGKLMTFDRNNELVWLGLFLQFVYFVTTTLFTIGYGDIAPKGLPGQLIALLIMVQGFLLVVVVFASIMGSENVHGSVQDTVEPANTT